MICLIKSHISQCKRHNCYFCTKASAMKNMNQITKIQLIQMVFKSIHSSKYTNYTIESSETFGVKILLELLLMYLLKKNFTKILLRYNKIKALINSKKTIKNKKGLIYQSLSNNIQNNLEILVQEIQFKTYHNTTNPKLMYVIQTDLILSHLEAFFKKANDFFFFNAKTPTNLISLAKSYSEIKDEVNVPYLIQKENKFCYSCILISFIVEELLNETITKIPDYISFVLSFEEMLNTHYKTNKIILILYDIKFSL